MDRIQNCIRGCMVGGASGDALGYPVEFLSYDEIISIYGRDGISAYKLQEGKALVSDDTQMTLFTANGLIYGETRGKLRGIMADSWNYVAYAYIEWYQTQTMTYRKAESFYKDKFKTTWLANIPELYSSRAPGMTCLSALERLKVEKNIPDDFIKERANSSKGCGGIMRTAPVALDAYTHTLFDSDLIAAECAAITHGHSLGFMPSAFLNHLLVAIIYEEIGIDKAVEDSIKSTISLFKDDKHIDELVDIIYLAVKLSENNEEDIDNITRLGEGWVAEEALAIALYCSLRYRDDFSRGIVAAVNHSGDSDSTGAIAGNILGTISGYDAICEKWKSKLELIDVILTLSDDLYTGCPLNGWDDKMEIRELWSAKYIKADYKI